MTSIKTTLKRKQAQQEILQAALPYIESGKYNQLSIREFCHEIGVTTGMFYRYYKTKSDLLAFYAIDTSKLLFDSLKDNFPTMSLREKLVSFCMASIKPLQTMGPESLFVFLNVKNPECNCDVSRQLFYDQIRYVFDSTYDGHQYAEEDLLDISNQLVILEKGIVYEWYSRQDDPTFELMPVAEHCFDKALDAYSFLNDEKS
ncbi:TetR/AcrR family transcriptional regulator [Secundilactobacillus mixtipabuli]|uniref:Transcriptional regulator n=1 Tax=Secundilactobacillus mixtipabuli TaxID=1435342 RepID=A0A1Z5I9U4_9LACO|nr:TetR/AcrR family transcriptional regulator [Secundilactobacillus mixtipabuli]GAW98494.1 transcriptional regulator [Secundilactobacillus mixtipabuli]